MMPSLITTLSFLLVGVVYLSSGVAAWRYGWPIFVTTGPPGVRSIFLLLAGLWLAGGALCVGILLRDGWGLGLAGLGAVGCYGAVLAAGRSRA